MLLSDAGDGRTIHSWELAGLPLALELNVDETAALAFTRAGVGAILSLEDGELFAAFRGAGGKARGLEHR